jgi:hypothetical protein
MNKLRLQIESPLKSGVPRETIVEPDETSALKEIGRTVAGFLKG